jgi:hypothetical protein
MRKRFIGLTLLTSFLICSFVALAGCGATQASDSTKILTSISVAPQRTSITKGATLEFTAMGHYIDGSTRNLTNSVSWSSSNSAVVSVESASGSDPGLAAGLAPGTAIISASISGVTGSTQLTVSSTTKTLVSVTVTPQGTTITVGASKQFTATGNYSDGSSANLTDSASWSSSNPADASIQTSAGVEPGLAAGVAAGTVTIAASSSGVSGSTQLSITSNSRTLVSVAVAPQGSSINVGATKQFAATGTYSDGSTANLTNSAAWSSSIPADASIQTIGGADPGLASGIAAGIVTIAATSSGVTGSTQFTITPNSKTLVSVAVAPQGGSVGVGATLQLTATGTYSDGSSANLTDSASWSSSNSADASIQTTGGADPGLASGVAVGTVTVTANSGGIKGTSQLTVTGGGTGSSISLNPTSLTLAVNGTQQFDAVMHFSNGTTQDVTTSAAWSSSASSAKVETTGAAQPGLATGAAAGPTTISATFDGITGSASVTVTDAPGGTTSIPLMDMTASQNYLNFQGGLYENFSDSAPADHNADALAASATIQPLDTNGNPSFTGTVVFVSFGMSNAEIEFTSFVTTVLASSSVNSTTLHVTNGAAGEQDACYWFPAVGLPSCNPDFENEYDRIVGNLSTIGLSANQVQVAWVDNANGRAHPENRGCVPFGSLCVPLCDPTLAGCIINENITNPVNEEEEFGETMRAAKQRFPNLKMVFFSSRVYGGYAQATDADPEPFAYQTGYGIKATIQAQINQLRTGIVDPVAGSLDYSVSPWIGWGPYFWADGDIPRSDGLVWCNGQAGPPCNGELDFGTDGLHLSTAGGQKAANLLLNWFLASPYTKSWFAAPK